MNELNIIRNVAKAYNNLDYKEIEVIASDNIVYESQNVFGALNGKKEVIDYLRGKFKNMKDSNNLVFAEIGILDSQKDSNGELLLSEGTLCLILSQGIKDNKVAVILVTTEDGKLARIDICSVAPHWSEAMGTGEFPR